MKTAVVGDVATELDPKLDEDDDTETDELADRTSMPAPPTPSTIRSSTPKRCSTATDTESWSDDPVRMYLTQMGEIPLLTRKEEISLARRIEITRAAFRRKLLACDYVIRSAVKVLNRVHRGELPFDRTVQVSVTDRLEKEQILGRLAAQPGDARTAARSATPKTTASPPARSYKPQVRRAAWHRLSRRRCRAVLLGRRTRPAHPADRADDRAARAVQRADRRAQGARSRPMKAERRPLAERKPLLVEYRNILRALQETPSSLRNRDHGISSGSTPSTSGPSAASRKATCGSWSRSPRSTATAACPSST